MSHGSTESMTVHGSIESREGIVSCSKKDSRIFHGFRLCAYARVLHGSDNHNRTISGQYEDRYRLPSAWKWSCSPQGQSYFELRNRPHRRFSNPCRCFLPNFSKKGFFVTEQDDKLRQRDRQRALLSLCAQAMVASQMGQTTLLSFLWTNWPNMVNELCGGVNENNPSNGQAREPDNTSVFQSPCWKVLLLGFACGSLIALAVKSSMSAGALLDSCFWLCLLCSLFSLATFIARVLCSAVMFIKRGGITELSNSCVQALQPKRVRRSYCQGSFAGLSTLLAGMFWPNRGLKPRSPTASSSVSSLWSRQSTNIEGKRVGSTKRATIRQVCSQPFGFLKHVLSKQI